MSDMSPDEFNQDGTFPALVEDYAIPVYPHLVWALGGDAAAPNAAYVLQQIHYWATLDKCDGLSDKAGNKWIYNSYPEWANQLGLSVQAVRTAIKRLASMKLIHTYSAPWMRNKNCYRINYAALENLLENKSVTFHRLPVKSNRLPVDSNRLDCENSHASLGESDDITNTPTKITPDTTPNNTRNSPSGDRQRTIQEIVLQDQLEKTNLGPLFVGLLGTSESKEKPIQIQPIAIEPHLHQQQCF